ncbi:DUF3157 family protein [Seonamhaeicola sediminis]|uniref:DUF3157 family protein n=1 Tax=Seonamhaeicola sediminis TaxID=2528206 RepID=A0A562YGA0_9FLAO|nr:DUF3157 family protein [Seonamhaeicola sediminis]TWO33850.1 DUF3157 family protein [Seonamhaeicola sediminis]
MKSIVYALVFLFSFVSFSQDNHIVKTEDGRRVLLKADFTWEYIDLVKPQATNQAEIQKTESSKETACNLPVDFEEPKLNQKIQKQLKKGRATMGHVKKKVAKDFKCVVEDVVLLSVKETKASGIYDFCVNGTKVSYKRSGHNVAKKLRLF